jgi:poly(A) polymerase
MKIDPLLRWHKQIKRQRDLNFVSTILKQSDKADIYLVGGFVRDLLIGRASKDIDFVVAGVPKSKLVTILRKHGTVSFVGRTFGVFKFVPKGKHGEEAIDIALPRIDLPKGKTGAYRDVQVVTKSSISIEEDLQRRDFTVNALAWSLRHKELIDLGQGLKDLSQKKLRTVGKAEERFKEDFSRMLRGLRFACQLGFDFEPSTWTALRRMVNHLNDRYKNQDVVPREVIAKELLKAFYNSPSRALDLYDRSGALVALIPEMTAMKTCPQPKPYHMEGTVWQHTVLALKKMESATFKRYFPERPDAELIMTVLFHDIGKPPTLKTPRKHGTDRIRFDGHDVIGGQMAKAIAERLKFASPSSASALHVDPENLRWLISFHLLLLHDRAREMKLATIEKYFLAHPLSIKLQQLILADSIATIPKSGRPYMKHLQTLWRIIGNIKQHGSKPPPPLLKGDMVMKLLGIASGPDVGFILRRLREEQLLRAVRTKIQATAFIKHEYAILQHRRTG